MPQPSLPAEIVGAILGLLWDTDLWSQEENPRTGHDRAVARCCLASKAFLPIARAELYRDACLEFSNTNTPAAITSLTLSSHNLIETLAGKAGFGALVRQITVLCRAEGEVSAIEDTIAKALDACTNLKSLRLLPPRLTQREEEEQEEQDGSAEEELTVIGALDRAIARRGHKLQFLGLVGHEWSGGRLGWVLEHLPALRRIQLDPGRLYSLADGTVVPYELDYFSTEDAVSSELLKDVLASSHSSLTGLGLEGPIIGDTFNFAPFQALQHLSIYMIWRIIDSTFFEKLLAAIGRCPALEDLIMYDSPLDGGPTFDLDDTDPLRNLPPTLVRLRGTSRLTLSTSYLLGALNSKEVPPRLAFIELSTQYVNEDGELAPRPASELMAISVLGEARGLEVSWEVECESEGEAESTE